MNKSTIDQIEKKIELKASPARVWKALTDYKEFGAWFQVNLDGPFVAGKTVHGQSTYPGCEQKHVDFMVQKLETEKYFSYRWHPYGTSAKDGDSKPTLVEFTLEKTATGTLLSVTESGFDEVSLERRAKAFEKHTEGWEEQLENIQKYVEPSA